MRENVEAVNLADRLGLPQPGLFITVDEVVANVRAKLDRAAGLENTLNTTFLRAEKAEAWATRLIGECAEEARAHIAIAAESDRYLSSLLVVEDEIIRLKNQAFDDDNEYQDSIRARDHLLAAQQRVVVATRELVEANRAAFPDLPQFRGLNPVQRKAAFREQEEQGANRTRRIFDAGRALVTALNALPEED